MPMISKSDNFDLGYDRLTWLFIYIFRNTTQHQAVLVGHMTRRYPDADCRDQIPFHRPVVIFRCRRISVGIDSMLWHTSNDVLDCGWSTRRRSDVQPKDGDATSVERNLRRTEV